MINKLKTLLNNLTIILLFSLALYRFRIRIPREIFENPTIVYLVVYIYIVVLNIILFVCVYLKFIDYEIKMNKSTRFLTVVVRINWWIDYSYKKFMDYIASIPGYFSEILATMTQYFIK